MLLMTVGLATASQEAMSKPHAKYLACSTKNRVDSEIMGLEDLVTLRLQEVSNVIRNDCISRAAA
jgi:hypothetical protein